MAIGIATKLGLALIALLASLPLLAWLSARAALDTELRHRDATRALPRRSEGATDGLIRIEARGLEFRARVKGLAGQGPALVLLHGFPETSIMWEPLIERAAAAGFRVLAFDQRGYSPDARPDGVDAYRISELSNDVFAVADAVGFGAFHLVAHDWGSIVGWAAAAADPSRVRSYASLSIPHPGAISAASDGGGPPLYVRVFRMRGVAETLLSMRDFGLMRRVLYASMSDAHLAEYLAVFSEPRALSAALAWYRALPNALTPGELAIGEVTQPVLYVYGRHDIPAYVGPPVQALHARYVTGPLEVVELEAGHWLMQDEPDRVGAELMRHLALHAGLDR